MKKAAVNLCWWLHQRSHMNPSQLLEALCLFPSWSDWLSGLPRLLRSIFEVLLVLMCHVWWPSKLLLPTQPCKNESASFQGFFPCLFCVKDFRLFGFQAVGVRLIGVGWRFVFIHSAFSRATGVHTVSKLPLACPCLFVLKHCCVKLLVQVDWCTVLRSLRLKGTWAISIE